jgi:hypothetical protein
VAKRGAFNKSFCDRLRNAALIYRLENSSPILIGITLSKHSHHHLVIDSFIKYSQYKKLRSMSASETGVNTG